MLRTFKMGNGSSQSVVLGPSRLQTHPYPMHNGYQYQRGVPKYVHPQNRVLPKPVAGQRLRTTDNGSILQSAGTIRGQRRDSNGREENADPEVMGILRKRSEMIEKENDCCHRLNFRNRRMFHSDPDIARRVSPEGYAAEEVTDSYSNKRSSSGGGAASRASKQKYKKKQRAPDPPPSENGLLSLPCQIDRRPQNRSMEERRNLRNSPCKCINKNKAPQPPSIIVHPPPPPPLPSSVTTRTKIGSPPTKNMPKDLSARPITRVPSITRAVECHDNKPSYEKNVHPLERWRNCRSSGDIRFDEQEPSGSRTTIFDSKKLADSHTKIPSYLPQKPDPFQKEIQAVTKLIAENRQDKPTVESKSQMEKNSSAKNASNKQIRSNSPPKFYFADTEVFKKENTNCKIDTTQTDSKMSANGAESLLKSSNSSQPKKHYLSVDPPQECTTTDEIVPSLQRFSPGRLRFKPSSRASTPTTQQKAEKSWDELSKNVYNNNKQEDDSDIDIRLRPVLPRKPLEVPKFSPTEAWQALGSDGLSSNQSTSDDGPESVTMYKKGVFLASDPENRNRRREVPFGLYDNRTNNNVYKHRSMSDSHWTPRQDLVDDSDVSSEMSEDAVVPRIRPNSVEIPTRFSLPSVMFSNMRPIGSDIKSNGHHSYFGENIKSKQMKKKTTKPLDNDPSMGPNFRKLLPKKSKYLSEEDIAVSDSNWTFGQHGLQKRGKKYSSDLMLSDKKKRELMMKSNYSDFLGDILVSKANHMRNQLKSSDSGNSNFSFYSTEGQIMYIPEKGGFVKEGDCSPPTKGRVYDMRKKFDPKLANPKANHWQKGGKKKPSPADIDLGRKRDLELAKMLEDEVRKRRNKEKITIRQQLQKMKNLNSDEEDDFDDEAYFTEPKSREESHSPFFQPGPSNNFPGLEFGYKPFRFSKLGAVTAADSSRLSHWQSSPALLEDAVTKNAIRPVSKGHFSSSSVMSSPDPDVWMQPPGIVDSWLQRQRNVEYGKKHLGSVPILEQSVDENGRLAMAPTDNANDGDVSSSPTPAPQKKKERRKTNIYKQLMDIVRKEEKHLRDAQRGNSEQDSRESSYSHRESSPSTSSESSSTSAYSYSDSSGSKNNGKNGVPANKEFHASGYRNSAQNSAPSFQVAFVQPYMPNKSYRPVPFEMNSAIHGYRMPGLQEESNEVRAEAS